MSGRHKQREQKIQEFVEASPVGQIDVEAGVIRGVRVLGSTSKNNRRYTAEAMAGAAKCYEGCQVFCDHAQGTGDSERSVGDLIGWLESSRYDPVRKEVRANLCLLKSHPLVPAILESATRNSTMFGLSHVALATGESVNGEWVCSEVRQVLSVDLVTRPATNSSLFESVVDPATDMAPDGNIIDQDGDGTDDTVQKSNLAHQCARMMADVLKDPKAEFQDRKKRALAIFDLHFPPVEPLAAPAGDSADTSTAEESFVEGVYPDSSDFLYRLTGRRTGSSLATKLRESVTLTALAPVDSQPTIEPEEFIFACITALMNNPSFARKSWSKRMGEMLNLLGDVNEGPDAPKTASAAAAESHRSKLLRSLSRITEGSTETMPNGTPQSQLPTSPNSTGIASEDDAILGKLIRQKMTDMSVPHAKRVENAVTLLTAIFPPDDVAGETGTSTGDMATTAGESYRFDVGQLAGGIWEPKPATSPPMYQRESAGTGGTGQRINGYPAGDPKKFAQMIRG